MSISCGWNINEGLKKLFLICLSLIIVPRVANFYVTNKLKIGYILENGDSMLWGKAIGVEFLLIGQDVSSKFINLVELNSKASEVGMS